MTTVARRQQLMAYLADATDNKVNALYILLEKEMNENTFTLSPAHINILEERQADYLAGKAKPSPWEDVHKRIRSKNFY